MSKLNIEEIKNIMRNDKNLNDIGSKYAYITGTIRGNKDIITVDEVIALLEVVMHREV